MKWTGLFPALALLAIGGGSARLEAQFQGSLTAGAAWERYRGNVSLVTVPHIDSAESVVAAASEWGFAGIMNFADSTGRGLFLSGEGGLRQFVAWGFQQRNYAPREHRFRLRTDYREFVWTGLLTIGATLDVRGVADLTPMPLYLAPGYRSYLVDAAFSRPLREKLEVDARVGFDERDYAGPSVLPTLDFLDRRSFEVQAGARRRFQSPPGDGDDHVRLFAAYLYHDYPSQARGDHALRLGGEWLLDRRRSSGLEVSVNASGTFNRSSSSRVEYNAARIEARAAKVVGSYLVSFRALWSGKSYVNPQEFLVPGEEFNNAAVFHGQVERLFLAEDMSIVVGAEWTRAETNISGDFFRRARATFGLQKQLRF